MVFGGAWLLLKGLPKGAPVSSRREDIGVALSVFIAFAGTILGFWAGFSLRQGPFVAVAIVFGSAFASLGAGWLVASRVAR